MLFRSRDVKRELVSLCIVYLLCILALYFTHLFNHMHICLVQHVKICKDAEGHAYTLCILNSMDQLFIRGVQKTHRPAKLDPTQLDPPGWVGFQGLVGWVRLQKIFL